MWAPLLLAIFFTCAAACACAAAENTIAEFERAANANPGSTEAWDRYGMALARDRRYREAARQYESALAIEPRNIEALRHLGVLEAWQGHYDSALARLERGLMIDAGNPELAADRANVLSWKGEFAAAMEAYEALLKITPENAGYWLKLAQLYVLTGHTQRARESYERVLSLDPANIDAYLGFANIYRDNHQYAEAERILRDGLLRFPADLRLTNELASLAAQKTLGLREMIELAEPAVFVVILCGLAIRIWHERRILRRRQLTARVLLPALPVLGALIGLVYADVLFAGAYYREVSAAARLLEPVAIGALFTLILVWRLRTARPPRQKTVLAIGAHPDDIEFGCGATLLRLREEGAATYGLVLTCGERGHDETAAGKVRIEEACSAARVMALADIAVHNFPDTLLHEHKAEIRAVIEAALARWRPDIIFTHNGHDVHTDHRTVFDATREAAREAYTILCYENPNTPPAFQPGYFFEVGKYIEGKIAALACHKTQMGKAYTASAVVRAMAGFRGTHARVPFAEGFEVMRVLEKERKQ